MEKSNIVDSFTIGYSREDGKSALVVLRPDKSDNPTDYEEVCAYFGDMADILYKFLCGVDCIRKVEVDPKYCD